MNDSLRCPKCACPNNKVLHTDTMQYPRALIIKRKRCCRWCKHVWTTTEKQLQLPQPIQQIPQEVDDHGSNGKATNIQPDNHSVSTDASDDDTSPSSESPYCNPLVLELGELSGTSGPQDNATTDVSKPLPIPLTSKQRKALKRKETKQRRKLESISPEVLPIPVNPAPTTEGNLDEKLTKVPPNPYLP